MIRHTTDLIYTYCIISKSARRIYFSYTHGLEFSGSVPVVTALTTFLLGRLVSLFVMAGYLHLWPGPTFRNFIYLSFILFPVETGMCGPIVQPSSPRLVLIHGQVRRPYCDIRWPLRFFPEPLKPFPCYSTGLHSEDQAL
jgi:hypothetical protein